MAQKVLIKKGVGSNVPAALDFGELAFADGSKKLYVGTNSSSVLELLDVDATAAAASTAALNAADIVTINGNVATNTTNITTNTDAITALDTATLKAADLVDEDDMVSDSDTKVPSQQSVKAYVDATVTSGVVGGMKYKGAYDAATNTPNIASGTAVLGDTYTVTVGGTFLGNTVEAGDMIIAEVNASAVSADFTIVQRNTDHSVFSLVADKGVASGFASLNADTEVVELPAGAAAAELVQTGSILLSDGTWTNTVDGGTF